jgi:hypothetical protein
MSELKLSPEDMAEIDRRFWTTVEEERIRFRYNLTRVSLSSVTKRLEYP